MQIVYYVVLITLFAFPLIHTPELDDSENKSAGSGHEDTLRIHLNYEELEAHDHDHEHDEDFFEFPAEYLYDEWNTSRIHPYDFDVLKFNDTILIDLLDSARYQFVMPINGVITSEFGQRRTRYHYGIDLRLRTGDPVYSAFDGVVRISQYSRTYGHVVVVRHFNGLETLYAHLSRRNVNIGDDIKAGEMVGLGGSTGRSSGPHLHFEVRYKGWALNPHDLICFQKGELHAANFQLTPSNVEYLKELKQRRYVTVRRGDTLSAIARRNHTTVGAICRLNGISSRSIIRPGQRLRVQ